MKALGSILKAIGVFSLVMTGLHLWRVGFPRLEGPEGESWIKVFSILVSYVIMGLISFGILGLGEYLGNWQARRMNKRFQNLKVGDFRPLTQWWQQSSQSDVLSKILTKIQKAPRLIYAEIEGKGQAFYNGEFLEYTLPNTKPLPTEMVDLIKRRGFEEYSEKTEDELMSRVRQRCEGEEVSAVGVIEGRPELVVLKTENNNMVIVDRTSFEYLFQRYKNIRAFDDLKPVLFYKATFVHGYLWPVV